MPVFGLDKETTFDIFLYGDHEEWISSMLGIISFNLEIPVGGFSSESKAFPGIQGPELILTASHLTPGGLLLRRITGYIP